MPPDPKPFTVAPSNLNPKLVVTSEPAVYVMELDLMPTKLVSVIVPVVFITIGVPDPKFVDALDSVKLSDQLPVPCNLIMVVDALVMYPLSAKLLFAYRVLPVNKTADFVPEVVVTDKSFTTHIGLENVQLLGAVAAAVFNERLLKFTPVVLVVVADGDVLPFMFTV